ncbi:hypothetical protein PRIPAC_91922 [Pristionchus pacificus]|uniref:KAT8 regulatory NSL complex subunit 2 n=1 Tax=Pristionchus pacificus TaxID=54126 RepID=A0A2A6B9T7_PRIPA|nr:hypothetical protein PRIPAC_91922 [Pristionchus pacificus]|eukprot:PDM62645.1 hypothetical protein PRIPAC_49860 [Pristionchus pacificus]
MSSPSSVDGAVSPSLDEHEDMDAEEHLDSSSSHVHDSSKEGEIDDQSTTKPKRNRKSTQRLLDSFTDEDFAFAHKHKKKKSHKKMDSSSDAHNESGGEASNDHEPEQVKEGRAKVPPRVVPGKLHLQCTFMESKKKSGTQCKQRVIDGYLFCIWHIMNDKDAPYKKCAHMRDKEKNGVKSRVQCKTAIRDTTEPPFCLAHSSDRRKKPSKKKREPSHAPSTSKGGSSVTASPIVAGSLAPSSRSSSIFNLRNEEFAQDIEEAIGNMDAGLNLMDTFDDFESLDDEEEIKEEDEDTVEGGSTVTPLPFEIDDELDEHERRLMDDIVVPVYAVGVKIIARLAKMRKNYNAGAAFWSACGTHPEVPTTIEEYNQKYIRDSRFDGMQISQARKDEIKGLINDSSSPIGSELAMLHKFNTDMLREQHSLQRSVLNNLPG